MRDVKDWIVKWVIYLHYPRWWWWWWCLYTMKNHIYNLNLTEIKLYCICIDSNIDGLSLPVGLCEAGYYCPTGSISARQVDCPQGFFCVEGSSVPEPCRNGTYGADDNLADESECMPCRPGYYCSEVNATDVSGPCSPGEETFLWQDLLHNKIMSNLDPKQMIQGCWYYI